jgi:hypothetical protein
MSLPAKLTLGVHLFAIAALMSAPLQALLNGTVAALPRQRALLMSIIVLFTGFQNFTTVMADIPKGSGYHMWFGIKVLLALHLMAINIVASNPNSDEAKKRRLLQGAAISGFVAILMATYVNYLRVH